MAPKLRGGHRQKRARLQGEAEPEVAQESPLAIAFVEKWACGGLTAVEIQNLAHLAVQSGCSSDMMTYLAEIGARGTQPGNCGRDLTR